MKPRVTDYVADTELTHGDMNAIQDRITDLQKRNGEWVGNEPWVQCVDGSTELVVGPHNGLVLENVELAALGATTVSLDGAFSGTGWWYLYAQNDGADGVEYVFSANAPDSRRLLCGVDSSLRYVCSVRVVLATLHIETILSFRKERETTTYRLSGLGYANFAALGNGTATTPTNIDLSEFLPPHARKARIRASLNSDSSVAAGDYMAKLWPNGAAVTPGSTYGTFDGDIHIGGHYQASTQEVRSTQAPIETDASRLIQYRLTAADGSHIGLSVYVIGFEE